MLYEFGEGRTYSELAVADLDGNGDKEIVAGYKADGSVQSEVCIFHHNGRAFGNNPIFTKTGYSFNSSPVICNVDNDDDIEIIFGSANSPSLYAINRDGTNTLGFPIQLDAKLAVNGGKIVNSSIKALRGSSVSLTNNGVIKLAKEGEMDMQLGATLDYSFGSTEIY